MRKINQMLEEIISSRGNLPCDTFENRKSAEEGGCGVTGFIASIPVGGCHIFEPSVQMHNRGNGKGGGIAAVGLVPKDLGVTQDVLDTHYILQVALIDHSVIGQVEKEFIEPFFDVYQGSRIPTVDDYREVPGLDVRPPDVHRYFVRVKAEVLGRFITENNLQGLDLHQAEDEFVHQNSYRLNQKFYASLGEKQAFVLSHGRNLIILKIVGFAELVAKYYLLDNFRAHGWIAHQRFPTKGRVWHPGGAHPFIGMHEALVHNGDFANYSSISEYLKQFNIYPQFLTDTEVSIQLFDLMRRNFNYPLEYIIEALAPTTEHDFDSLPLEKQKVYRHIQQAHMQCSPDGPWFFIIARNDVANKQFQLLGITDTAMLRPQVFAMQNGEVQIGLICSEKQAIDATLQSLASEDKRFCTVADRYWNARGGSSTDGGAFIFTVKDAGLGDGSKTLTCTNKFGEVIKIPDSTKPGVILEGQPVQKIDQDLAKTGTKELKEYCRKNITDWSYMTLQDFCRKLSLLANDDDEQKAKAIAVLNYLNDIRMPVGDKKRSLTLQIIRDSLTEIFAATPKLNSNSKSKYKYIDWPTRNTVRTPRGNETILVLNAKEFQPEGDDCDARLIVTAYKLGWKQFIAYGYKGQRFTGCGLSSNSSGVRIDVYDSSGDYLASGIDGMEIYVHGNAQDQLGQILKSGKLVIYGDVGQTLMYGAKGGDVYIMGNAAGRPLINAVGKPRVVINGTCLDYLAESFMAGDPLNGGGFVILNGIIVDNDGKIVPQDIPYAGSNLFSLASGGAIFIRDPDKTIVSEQLNGGELVDISEKDWELILLYLQENERLFCIKTDDLLTVKGIKRKYTDVYRKVQPVKTDVLAAITPVDQDPDED
jgi:glutamate synthase domain-containing protein 1/glutamate synthase domain-containing protein 3